MSYKNQRFSNGGLGSDCRPRQVPIGTMARSTQKQSLSLTRAYSPHARVRVQVTLVTLLSPSRLPLVSSGGSFWAFLEPAGKMAVRRPLGGQSGRPPQMGPQRLSTSSQNHMKTYTFCNASPLRSTSKRTSTALHVFAKSYENQYFFRCEPLETHLRADLNDCQCHTKTNTLTTVSDLKGHAGHRLSPPS